MRLIDSSRHAKAKQEHKEAKTGDIEKSSLQAMGQCLVSLVSSGTDKMYQHLKPKLHLHM